MAELRQGTDAASSCRGRHGRGQASSDRGAVPANSCRGKGGQAPTGGGASELGQGRAQAATANLGSLSVQVDLRVDLSSRAPEQQSARAAAVIAPATLAHLLFSSSTLLLLRSHRLPPPAATSASSSPRQATVGKSRCQPSNLHPFIKRLVDKQARAIKQVALGNTLKLKLKNQKLCKSLTDFLIKRVNCDDYTLELGDPQNPVVIDLFAAAANVFGLMNKGKKFDLRRLGHGKKAKKRTRSKYSDFGDAKIFANGLRNCSNLRKKTCKIYMYTALQFLLASSTSLGVDLRYDEIVEDVDHIKDWDLTHLVVKLLVDSIRSINEDDSSYLVGSPLLLVVIFLDMIDHPELEKLFKNDDDEVDVFPRLQNILDEHLSWLYEFEGQWGSLNIKPLSASYYSEDIVYEMETNYDWGLSCDDSWDEEKDDDLSHIQSRRTGDISEEDSEGDAGESSKNVLSREEVDEVLCLASKLKETSAWVHNDKLAIPSDVEKIIGDFDLPKDISSSLREALKSAFVSKNTEVRNKLQAIQQSIATLCTLIQLSRQDSEGQSGKKKSKLPPKGPLKKGLKGQAGKKESKEDPKIFCRKWLMVRTSSLLFVTMAQEWSRLVSLEMMHQGLFSLA
ncbi:hypothetical protein ACQ4PT_013334 [Festuca glaucescens]